MFPMLRMFANRRRRERNRNLIMARRTIRETHNPFSLPERRFIELYRVNKAIARFIITELRNHLHNPTSTRGIKIERKIFATLRFYATGSYQRSVGEEYNCGLSQSAIHFCIHEVTRAIVAVLVPRFITFPNIPEQINSLKRQFMDKFGFPGVIGAIDCSHIAILKPSVEEHNFINRKGFHSINCQLICDPNLYIINIFANYGGSTHDSFIWNNSQIKLYLTRNQIGWLIGDSGYPQSTILMTPFREPAEGTPEARYNQAHMRARNTVERCIGLLKVRFRCLLKERSSRYTPAFMCSVIKACAVLHNICLTRNIVLEDEVEAINANDDFINAPIPNQQVMGGIQARQRLVERYFM